MTKYGVFFVYFNLTAFYSLFCPWIFWVSQIHNDHKGHDPCHTYLQLYSFENSGIFVLSIHSTCIEKLIWGWIASIWIFFKKCMIFKELIVIVLKIVALIWTSRIRIKVYFLGWLDWEETYACSKQMISFWLSLSEIIFW